MTSTLETIPSGKFRLTFNTPQFTKRNDEWMLVGPDYSLPLDGRIDVFNWTQRKTVSVRIVEYVAERLVRRTPGSYLYSIGPSTVRYVIARFK